MKCTNCNTLIQKNQLFCSACGFRVLNCSACGTAYRPGDRFCGQCGEKIEIFDEKPSYKAKPERIHNSSTKFEGLRKHVTILFSDIKDSTALIESQDPEEARTLLSPVIQEMLSAVYRYNGLVIHTAGDGIVALFGAPQALEDHGLRSCLAALRIIEQVNALNANINLRIGLNSGEVYLDIFGDDQYQEFDAIGPAVNLASRLEQTASPGTIQISKNTLKLVENYIEYRELPPVELKGFTDLIERYQLIAIKETHFLYQTKNNPLDNAFINRKEESEELESLVALVNAGNGQGVSVSSDAGVGKSRLVYKFIKSEALKDYHCIVSGGFSHTNNIPLFPVVNLFRNLMNVHRNDTLIQAKLKITPWLEKINAPYAMNAMLTLLEIIPFNSEWDNVDNSLKSRYILEIGISILLNYSQTKPLIIITEDLQWVDEETEKFLGLLLENLGNSRILLLISYRTGYQDKWLEKAHYRQIKLKPFSDENIDEFISSILGDNPGLFDIKRRLITVSAGNPFFAQEMIKALIANRIIFGQHGDYVLNTNVLLNKLELPESIFAVLQMQMDNLPSLQKRILQICSVINEQFNYSLLAELIEFVDIKDLRNSINELLEKQFIYERKIYPEPEFSFKHTLIQEVSYNSLLKTTRRNIHLKIFHILEKNANPNQVEEMQVLATHAYLGEEWNKAFEYCVKTAEISFMMSAHNVCVEFYTQALSAAEHLPRDEETLKKIMTIHYELNHVYIRTGQFRKQKIHLDETMKLALALGDKYVESIVNSSTSIYYLGLFGSMKAIQYAQNGYSLAQEIHSNDALIIAEVSLFHCHFFLGNFPELARVGEKMLQRLPDINYFPPKLRAPVGHLALNFMSWGDSYTGNFMAVQKRQDFWFSSTNIQIPSISSMCALGAVGINYFFMGNFEKAADFLSKALNYSIELGIFIFIPVYASRLSICYLYFDQTSIAQNYLTKAIETVDMIQGTFASVFSLNPICTALLLSDRHEELEKRSQDAMQIFLDRNLKAEEAQLLLTMAQLDLLRKTPSGQTEKNLRRALELFEDLGMKTMLGHVYLALADLYSHQPDMKKSRKLLEKSRASFRELDMEFWAQKSDIC